MNMRKIIAILTSVLLLCAAIPMGALSVAADGGFDFENGSVSGWQSGCSIEVIDLDGSKVLKFDASGADWANIYYYGSSIVSANTDYTVSLRVKADRDTNMNFKVNNNWAGDTAKETFNVTTEWQNISFVINSGACTNGALLLFSSNTTAANGATYYLDDISFVEYVEAVEPEEPVVDGNLVLDWNFDDGVAHFTRGVAENGYMVFDATTADWQNCYSYINSIVAEKDYVVTFKAKADKKTSMNLKVNDNWGGDAFVSTVNVTTAWQYFTVDMNCSPFSASILMFSSNSNAANAAIYYIDDVKIYEKPVVLEPGVITNGDFETGDLSGWEHHQSTAISTDAHSGSYAANIKGNGGWGGMLNQNVAVEVGKTYKISLWVKAIANGANIQVKDGGTDGANLASTWFTKNEWTNVVWEVTPTTDIICFNFCGGGNGIAEDVLVDDITIAEVKVASFDGYLYNGDFETGEAAPWTMYSGTAVSADAAYTGNYGVHITNPTGGWGGTAYQDFNVVVGKTYNVTMWAKTLDGARGQNIQIQNPIGTTVDSTWFDNKTEWTLLSFEFTATTTDVRINICGGGTNANEEIYVDDIKVTEVSSPVVEGIWHADFNDGDKKFNAGDIVAEGPDGSDCLKWTANGGWSAIYTVLKNMDSSKNYTLVMKVKASVDGKMGVTIQNGDWGSYWNAPAFDVTTGWKTVYYQIPANSIPFTAGSILFKFQDVGQAMDLYVDDMVLYEGLIENPEQPELPDASFDGYIYNGDFETGALDPWYNLYGGDTISFVEGYESTYAMQMIAGGQWRQVRQDKIPVEPNTTYRLSAYVKNANNMAIVIKKGDDSGDLTPGDAEHALPSGNDWQLYELEFNTGYDKDGNAIDINSICILVISYEKTDASVIIDNIKLEKVEKAPCEHEYEYECSKNCSICGEETRPEAECVGDPDFSPCEENACDYCGETIAPKHAYVYACDQYCNECGEKSNPDATHSIVHVEAKPAVSCVEYGNIEYWYCEHCSYAWLDEDCTRDTNLKRVIIAGECVSNAEYPCQVAPCIGCGMDVIPDEPHTYDNDYDATCNVCGDIREVEAAILYGDANGDGEVTALDSTLLSQYLTGWDVTLNEAAADANGDGEITALDSTLLSQYLTGWDVQLGPDEPVEPETSDFNDGELDKWPEN